MDKVTATMTRRPRRVALFPTKAAALAALYATSCTCNVGAFVLASPSGELYRRQGVTIDPTLPTSEPATTEPTTEPSTPSSNPVTTPTSEPSTPPTSVTPGGGGTSAGGGTSGGGGGGGGGGTSAGGGGGTSGGTGGTSAGGGGGGGVTTTRPGGSPTTENGGDSSPGRTYGGGDGNNAGSIATTPLTVTQVTVVSGVAVTQTLTVMPSQTVDPSLVDANSASSGGFFDNTGAVVGVFLVVGLACAAIILGALFFWRRRKRQRALDEDVRIAAGGAGAGGAGINRFGDDDDDDDGLPSSMSQVGAPMRPNSALGGNHNYFALPTGAGGQAGSGSDMTHHRTISSGSAGAAGVGNGGGYWPPPGPGVAYGAGGLPGSNSRHNSMHEAGFGPDPAQTPVGLHYDDWSEYLNGGRGSANPAATSNALPAGAAAGDFGSDEIGYAYGRASDSAEGSSGGSADKDFNEKKSPSASDTSTLPVDQRLDARAMLKFMQDGTKNASTDSLKDSSDYTRRILKVTNATDGDD